MTDCRKSSVTNVAVILRIKRLRCEDAAEALSVHSTAKRLKIASEDHSATSHVQESSIFHFVGTEDGKPNVFEPRFERVFQEIKRRARNTKPNPFAKLTISDKKESMKGFSKSAHSRFRYKLLTESRADHDQSAATSVGRKTQSPKEPTAPAADLPSKDRNRANLLVAIGSKRGPSNAKKVKEKASSKPKDYFGQTIRLYDLVQEEPTSERRKRIGKLLGSASEDITLSNAMKTINLKEENPKCCAAEKTTEKFSVQGVSSDADYVTSDADYVTDVFYTDNCPVMTAASFDWSSLMAVRAPDLGDDIFNEDSFDEDDSNDEDQPCNEYPNEEDEDEEYTERESNEGDSDCRHHYKQINFDDSDEEDVCKKSHSSAATSNNWYMRNAAKLGAARVKNDTSCYDLNIF